MFRICFEKDSTNANISNVAFEFMTSFIFLNHCGCVYHVHLIQECDLNFCIFCIFVEIFLQRKCLSKYISQIVGYFVQNYRQTSNISSTLVGSNIVDHSDVVGASPVSAAPIISSFSTWLQWIVQIQLQDEMRNVQVLRFGGLY